MPSQVVVFLEGIVIAAICDNVELGNFKDSVNDWADIDAELILFLFLPVLIFGEAMSLKWHHVKGVFVQSLLLAGPGVGIGAILMASFAKYALPYNWGWNLCMVFGSILAATDPVAVVALLKNAGASPKLTILIIGESLMNDGTAMVLFNLFFNMMKGDRYDFGGIVMFFIEMALGAPLLGIAFGLVTVWLMQKADRSMSHDDVTVQIAITFCCAYLVFFTAEYECEISGVLACCGAGIMLAWKAPPLILDPDTMHHVWGMIEWVANTIIFMLAGLIIGQESLNKVQPMDWAYLILLYVVLSIIRCIIMIILYPLLSTSGLKCTPKDAVFISWAGLRGALAMSLALIVKKSDEISIGDEDADRVFFFVGGIAAITILMNAVFASTILDKLGLLTTEESPDKMMVLKQVQKRLRKKSVDLVLKLSKEMAIQDPSTVVRHNSLLKNFIKRTTSTTEGYGLDDMSWITDAMRSVSGVQTQSYWQHIEAGKLPRESYATQTLLYSIDIGLDLKHEVMLRDYAYLEKEFDAADYQVELMGMLPACTPYVGHLIDVFSSRNEKREIYMLSSFIDAHEVAQRKIVTFLGHAPLAGAEEEDEIDSDLTPEEKTDRLSKIDPEIIKSVISKQAALIVLSRQKEYIESLIHDGLLSEKDGEVFFDKFRRD
ncbi:unnamed protein product, partial [Ectocarpus fasciculatus]